ncbi:hypothetical protein [Desulfobacula sp.]|uniref:hypothetical protein n=1 Tax=Desulfobacula sp. TaxID=2593537 RepID=UPI002714BBA9|nr:hypothetical protein [Desulfobacula sp.]
MNGKFIIDDLDLRDSLDETELEADRVAQEGLIPENLWAENNNYRILYRQVGHKEVRKLFFFKKYSI